MNLKKGWQRLSILSIFITLIVSYGVVTLLYQLKTGVEFVGAFMQPQEMYEVIIQDENLKKIVLFVPLIVLAATVYLLRKNIFDSGYDDASDFGIKGTARWGDPASLCDGRTLSKQHKFSTSAEELKRSLDMEEGTIIGKVPNKKKSLIVQDDTSLITRNVLVNGPSGSGKGQAYVLPNLVNVRNESMIVVDPKGENYHLTAQLKKDQGYDVYNIDFADFSRSRYNPLDYVRNDEDAQKVSQIMTSNSTEDGKEDFFSERAQKLLAGLISYVKAEYPPEQANMKKVIETFNKYVSDPKVCDEWLENMDDEQPAKGLLISVLSDLTSQNTRSSVTSSFQSIVSIYQLKRIQNMTATSDFYFDNLQDNKSIVYVKLPVPTNPYKSLTSVFFTQMIDRLFDMARENPMSVLDVPVHFLLDEFPNIGRIPGYQETLALCRGYRIYMHTIIQEISQLEDRQLYGKEVTRGLLGNHSAILILKVGEHESAKYWSGWFEDTTVKYKDVQTSVSKSGKSTSYSNRFEQKKLLPPNELMEMEDNTAYLLLTGYKPMKIEKAWQFKLYPSLLSDKNKQPNYLNMREKLGFTGELLHDEETANNEVHTFAAYQTAKKEKPSDNENKSFYEEVIERIKETVDADEKDINEVKEHVTQSDSYNNDDADKTKEVIEQEAHDILENIDQLNHFNDVLNSQIQNGDIPSNDLMNKANGME